jgi:hypothetical protein
MRERERIRTVIEKERKRERYRVNKKYANDFHIVLVYVESL